MILEAQENKELKPLIVLSLLMFVYFLSIILISTGNNRHYAPSIIFLYPIIALGVTFAYNFIQQKIFKMDFLKGNYKIKKKINSKKLSEEEKLEKKFEEQAKKRIGGSMVFVSKKKVNWDLEE